MIRRLLSVCLILLLLFLSASCDARRTVITREEIVAAYEAAGYCVTSSVYDEKLDYGEVAYIQANHPNGDYIYFAIFETQEEAKAYKKEFYHPVIMSLFSIIFGDPCWPRWEVHGCIVVEYDEPDFLEPFKDLMKNK